MLFSTYIITGLYVCVNYTSSKKLCLLKKIFNVLQNWCLEDIFSKGFISGERQSEIEREFLGNIELVKYNGEFWLEFFYLAAKAYKCVNVSNFFISPLKFINVLNKPPTWLPWWEKWGEIYVRVILCMYRAASAHPTTTLPRLLTS